MMPAPPKSDMEVALNQADAHLMNDDWEGGARVLRRYLATDPKNLRAREMLAWALEGGGNMDEEIEVRRGLVADYPTFAHKRDYGRALERGYNFPGARDQYGGALATTTGNQDQALVTSYNRMRYRTSPELTAGTSFRSDPQAWAWRLQAGASLPFGIRNHLAFMALHDFSGDWRANQVVGANVFDKNGSITTLASQLFLGYWREGYLLAGLDGRFSTSSGVTADGQTLLGTNRSIDIGGNGELDVTPLRFMRINTHIDINEQWYEAPIAVHEGGTMTGAISHVYLYPKTRWVLFDGGASVRRLTLAAQAGLPQSTRGSAAGVGRPGLQPVDQLRAHRQERSHGRTAGAAGVHERRVGALVPELPAVHGVAARLPHQPGAARVDQQRLADLSQGAVRRTRRPRPARRRRLGQLPAPHARAGRRRASPSRRGGEPACSGPTTWHTKPRRGSRAHCT